MRVLDRERQRGAQLIAVERAMAGLAQPARAKPVPVLLLPAAREVSHERSPLKPARPGRYIRCRPKRRKQSLVRQHTGRSGLPSPAAMESPRPRSTVAHRDLGDRALRRPVRHRHIDRHARRVAVAEADAHLLAARAGVVARCASPSTNSHAQVVCGGAPMRRISTGDRSAPDRTRACRRARRSAARRPSDRRTGSPASSAPSRVHVSVAISCSAASTVLRLSAARCFAKSGFAAEQAEPVLHLPDDVQVRRQFRG